MNIYRVSVLLELSQFTGFEWDDGNDTKTWTKHRVSKEECEQVFFNEPLLLLYDESHSQSEPRYFLLGRTDGGRELFVVFTGQGPLIRVISARDQTKTERERYYEED
jgi:uncharacterized DUF497 family protein